MVLFILFTIIVLFILFTIIVIIFVCVVQYMCLSCSIDLVSICANTEIYNNNISKGLCIPDELSAIRHTGKSST